MPSAPPCPVQVEEEEEAVYEEPPEQETLYEEPPMVGSLWRGQAVKRPQAQNCSPWQFDDVPCPPPPKSVLSPGLGQGRLGSPGPQTSPFFPIHGQVQLQEASSAHVDHYPGLSGKGLCARALYDYQAGNVL